MGRLVILAVRKLSVNDEMQFEDVESADLRLTVAFKLSR
jgi:hypothetical protein